MAQLSRTSPTARECHCNTSLQRIHKRPAYSPGHAQFCVCRRHGRHYTEHRLCTYRGNTDLSSSRTLRVIPQTNSARIRQLEDAAQHKQSAHTHRNRPIGHQESGEKSYGTDMANYGRKAPTQWASWSCVTPEIAEQLHQMH